MKFLYKNKVIGHTPPSKNRSSRRPRWRSSHKPPLETAAGAEGSDQLQNKSIGMRTFLPQRSKGREVFKIFFCFSLCSLFLRGKIFLV